MFFFLFFFSKLEYLYCWLGSHKAYDEQVPCPCGGEIKNSGRRKRCEILFMVNIKYTISI